MACLLIVAMLAAGLNSCGIDKNFWLVLGISYSSSPVDKRSWYRTNYKDSETKYNSVGRAVLLEFSIGIA